MITGVVRNDEHEIRRRFENRAALFDREPAAVIRQRVNDDDGVFTRFDYFVEIAKGPVGYRGR